MLRKCIFSIGDNVSVKHQRVSGIIEGRVEYGNNTWPMYCIDSLWYHEYEIEAVKHESIAPAPSELSINIPELSIYDDKPF